MSGNIEVAVDEIYSKHNEYFNIILQYSWYTQNKSKEINNERVRYNYIRIFIKRALDEYQSIFEEEKLYKKLQILYSIQRSFKKTEDVFKSVKKMISYLMDSQSNDIVPCQKEMSPVKLIDLLSVIEESIKELHHNKIGIEVDTLSKMVINFYTKKWNDNVQDNSNLSNLPKPYVPIVIDIYIVLAQNVQMQDIHQKFATAYMESYNKGLKLCENLRKIADKKINKMHDIISNVQQRINYSQSFLKNYIEINDPESSKKYTIKSYVACYINLFQQYEVKLKELCQFTRQEEQEQSIIIKQKSVLILKYCPRNLEYTVQTPEFRDVKNLENTQRNKNNIIHSLQHVWQQIEEVTQILQDCKYCTTNRDQDSIN